MLPMCSFNCENIDFGEKSILEENPPDKEESACLHKFFFISLDLLTRLSILSMGSICPINKTFVRIIMNEKSFVPRSLLRKT